MEINESYAVIDNRGRCIAFQPYNPMDKIERLEQENTRLKKEIRLYDCIEKWGTKECHCACRCLGNEFCKDADKKIDKYRQALQEIKEIAKQGLDKEHNGLILAEQILQKISEVNE